LKKIMIFFFRFCDIHGICQLSKSVICYELLSHSK